MDYGKLLTPKKDEQTKAVLAISQALFQAEVQWHIMHLQTLSYAQHKALDELYSGIIDLNDQLIEKTQGKYGILKGYKSMEIKEDLDCCKYTKDLLSFVEQQRTSLKDGYIEQLTDNIIDHIASGLYKLENLS